MNQQEIAKALQQKGLREIEVVDDTVLADAGLQNEYWFSFHPDSDGGWLRAVLYSADPVCLRDKLYQSLDEAISELMILAVCDFARFHELESVR